MTETFTPHDFKLLTPDGPIHVCDKCGKVINADEAIADSSCPGKEPERKA